MEATNAQARQGLPDLPQRAEPASCILFLCFALLSPLTHYIHYGSSERSRENPDREYFWIHSWLFGSASQMFTHLTSHPESWLQNGGGLGSERLVIGPPVSLPRGRKGNDCGHSDHRTQAASVGPCGRSIELRGCSTVLVSSLHVMCGAGRWGCQDDPVTIKLR